MSIPLSLLAVAVLSVAITAFAAEPAVDETTLPADVVAMRDLVYATRPTGPVKLDVFTPPGDGPFPLVVWIHGGAWKMGDKASWSHMNFLVGNGFAVANVGYRFSQVATYPAQFDDASAALDFLAAHAGDLKIDARRIAFTGESAGGHLASLVGLTRPATTRPAGGVRAVIDLFGPTDIAALSAARNDAHSALDELLGGPVAERGELASQASPIRHVSKDAPPFLVIHGVDDTLVPIDQSERLVAALKAAGAKAEFVRVPDAGHAGPAFWTDERRDGMLAFLRRHLDIR